jgi:hypothetical protein
MEVAATEGIAMAGYLGKSEKEAKLCDVVCSIFTTTDYVCVLSVFVDTALAAT